VKQYGCPIGVNGEKEEFIMVKEIKKSLREKAQEMKNGLPFMEGREKGELDRIMNEPVTIIEYGFMPDGEGEDYVAFIVDEDPQHFFFGGQVLTENMHELDEEGYHEQIVKEGLPLLLGKKKSKNKREYTTVTFYPEA